MARVLIYYMAQDQVILIVNGDRIGEIGAGGKRNRFELSAPLAVDRGRVPEPRRLGSEGSNLIVMAPIVGSPPRALRLTIGGHVPQDVDLQLFIFSRSALLVDGHEETLFAIAEL